MMLSVRRLLSCPLVLLTLTLTLMRMSLATVTASTEALRRRSTEVTQIGAGLDFDLDEWPSGLAPPTRVGLACSIAAESSAREA